MTEPAGIDQRWALFEQVPAIVDTKFQDGRSYAQTAYNDAVAAINALKAVASALNSISTATLTEIAHPTRPTFATSLPSSPTATFESPTAPTIGNPSGTLPEPAGANFGTPTTPTVREPSTSLPASPNISMSLPTSPADTDTLQGDILTKLINIISGGTLAIPTSVETSMFERDTERATELLNDELDTISSEWSKRGFTLPNAILAAQLTQAQINYTNKRLDVSRDIAIKNAELTDANIRTAIQNGLGFLQNRILIWKTVTDTEIVRIDQILRKYLGDIESSKTSIQKDISLSDLDIKLFASESNAESARNDVILRNHGTNIELYRASGQVFGIKTDADVKLYVGQVQAESARLESILKKYSGDNDNYRASFQSITSLSEADARFFAEEVRQEIAKVEIAIKNTDLDIKNFEVENNLKMEAEKAIGNIAAQITAGALSSVSASATITASDSGVYSYSSNPTY